MVFTRLAALLVVVLTLPVRAADLDPHLPTDTESYLTIHVRQLLDAPLLKKQAIPALRDLLRQQEEVANILEELGFDPFKDLDRLTLATPAGLQSADRGLLIAHGRFDVNKFKQRAEEAARDNEEALKIHKIPLGGGASHLAYEVNLPGVDHSFFVALASNRTLLAAPAKDYIVDALKNARAGKKVELKNRDFQALVEKLDPKLTLTVAVLGKSFRDSLQDLLPPGSAQSLEAVEAIGGGLSIGDELRLDLLIASKDAASARTIREAGDKLIKLGLVGLSLLGEDRKELNLLLEVLKTVKVADRGKVVSVTARLTADVLDDLFRKDE